MPASLRSITASVAKLTLHKNHAHVRNQSADSRLLGKQSYLDCYDNSSHVHSAPGRTPVFLLLQDCAIKGALYNLLQACCCCMVVPS